MAALVSDIKAMAVACGLQNADQIDANPTANGAVRMIQRQFLDLRESYGVQSRNIASALPSSIDIHNRRLQQQLDMADAELTALRARNEALRAALARAIGQLERDEARFSDHGMIVSEVHNLIVGQCRAALASAAPEAPRA